jgi:DNA-binding Lrp family transcriptional regulator
MPVKYDVSEKSIALRNKILAICKYEPKSLREISKMVGMSVNAIRFNVDQLLESGHLVVGGKALNGNNKPCGTYIATDTKYVPNSKPKADVLLPKDKSLVTLVSADDYHTTRSASRKQNVWIGSTFSTMAF